MGLGFLKVGRKWAHYTEDTATTSDALSVPIPIEAMENTDFIYLSKHLQDLMKMRVSYFPYSVYNEFSYSLGVLMY